MTGLGPSLKPAPLCLGIPYASATTKGTGSFLELTKEEFFLSQDFFLYTL